MFRLTLGVWVAGLIARTVEDVQFLDAIFNDCPRTDQAVSLEGMRIGYPYNWWDDLGEEVRCVWPTQVKSGARVLLALHPHHLQCGTEHCLV